MIENQDGHKATERTVSYIVSKFDEANANTNRHARVPRLKFMFHVQPRLWYPSTQLPEALQNPFDTIFGSEGEATPEMPPAPKTS